MTGMLTQNLRLAPVSRALPVPGHKNHEVPLHQHISYRCSKRFVFVNTDACMAAQGVTIAVLHKLKVSFWRTSLQSRLPRIAQEHCRFTLGIETAIAVEVKLSPLSARNAIASVSGKQRVTTKQKASLSA